MKVTLDIRPFSPPVRADYWAAVIGHELIIVDADQGNMSVTNDLEAVLLEVFRDLIPDYVDLPALKILYRDTMGQWDRIEIGRENSGVYTAEILPGSGEEDPPDFSLFKTHGKAIGSMRA